QIDGPSRFGKCNDVTNGRVPRQDHHQSIKSERDASVRRRTELERFEKEAEFVASFLRGESENVEDPRLNVASMDSDRAAADLGSIQHEIISLSAYPSHWRRDHFETRVTGGSERMRTRDPAVVGRNEVEKRKTDTIYLD